MPEPLTIKQHDYLLALWTESKDPYVQDFLKGCRKTAVENLSKDEAGRLIEILLELDDTSSRMNLIPAQIRSEEFRFCRVLERQKRAFEKGWQIISNYGYASPMLLEHLQKGGNYGVICGYGNLAVVDIDNANYLERVANNLPPTFTVKTKKGQHLYYRVTDGIGKSRVLRDIETNDTIGDLKAGLQDKPQGRGYVVGPGCIHPSGSVYEVFHDRDVHEMSSREFKNCLLQASVSSEAPLINAIKPVKTISFEPAAKPAEFVREPAFVYCADPDYLRFLPIWYRSYHRARHGDIFRGADGRIVHLRICETLMKHGDPQWRDWCHDLTRWMFADSYDHARTEYELDHIDSRYSFGDGNKYEYKGLEPLLEYLTPEELDEYKRYGSQIAKFGP